MTSLGDLGLAVKRLQWTHHRECDRRLAQLGVSLVQWDVLRHLSEVPESSLHDLAVLTFQTDQAMGELARRMVDRGLLTRESGPGRIVRHRLTATGETARADGATVVNSVFSETIGRLTPAERATLYGLLLRATTNG